MTTGTFGRRLTARTARLAIALAGGLGLSTGVATAKVASGTKAHFCTDTSNAWFKSCSAAAADDYWVAKAKCINVSDDTARADCFQTAKDDRKEAAGSCKEGLDWRLSICKKTGQERYDPAIDPANFETDYHHLMNPNVYFPLGIGNHWKYAGSGEINTVDILDHTKLISGVTCIVAQDLVFDPVNLSESTNDWYCQAKDTTVWYFGEETGEYVTTPGDDPPLPELVTIEGSFKQGRDGSKAGIIFEASPAVGDTYVEESAIGDAEDATDILSTTYAYGTDKALDQFVPAALANLLCANHDCVVTSNYSLLEPNVFGHKYYARGIGVFLEVDPATGDLSQLVDCDFPADPDARCKQLPQP